MLQPLIDAEARAEKLFQLVEEKGFIKAGVSEKELNDHIYALAFEHFNIEKYWHKRIVRAGKNTLLPYAENPPNLEIQADDILFLDFGPIFEEYEADFGRTYVIGNDPKKKALRDDLEKVWNRCTELYFENPAQTGAEFYDAIKQVSEEHGWIFGGPIGGHLIGIFPHEKLEKEDKRNYIHPDNHQAMNMPDTDGNPRYWILEIHLLNQAKTYGGFFEQIMYVK